MTGIGVIALVIMILDSFTMAAGMLKGCVPVLSHSVADKCYWK